MDRELLIDISAAGSVKIEAVNCTGDECVKLSEPIEIVLGGVQVRKEKPEYYQNPGVSTAQSIRNAF
jgi:hypothetical protein